MTSELQDFMLEVKENITQKKPEEHEKEDQQEKEKLISTPKLESKENSMDLDLDSNLSIPMAMDQSIDNSVQISSINSLQQSQEQNVSESIQQSQEQNVSESIQQSQEQVVSDSIQQSEEHLVSDSIQQSKNHLDINSIQQLQEQVVINDSAEQSAVSAASAVSAVSDFPVLDKPLQQEEVPEQRQAQDQVLKQEQSIIPQSAFAIQEVKADAVDPVLIKEQFKILATSIRHLKKKKDAVIFLNPVDPVALNIPSYFDVIKNPMDISTIEKKLSRNEYENYHAVLKDFDLMFNNCYTFNGNEGAVSLMAKQCQAWLKKEAEKIPASLAETSKQKKRQSLPMAAQPVDKKRLTSRKSGSLDIKFCSNIHKEFLKKANHPVAWPFLAPVDPIALGIPQYRTIVKTPMDLSTIKKKLDSGEYDTADDFEADIRLMLENCYLFNGVGSDIYNIGKQFEALFNLKWNERNIVINNQVPVVEKGHVSESDEDDEDSRHISMLKTQLNLLNQQLKMLQDKKDKKREKRRASRQSISQSVPVVEKVKKPVKRVRKKRSYEFEDEKMPVADISYEQKRELSDNINILPADKLPQVFEIIKENANLNAVEDEEIELDIDSLDKPVLWKLYLFVKKHTRPPKKPKLDEGDAAIVGPVSSSSESDGGDSVSETGVQKKSRRSTLALKRKHPKVSGSGRKPGSAAPLPFRTEKGEMTNYTSNFKVEAIPQPATVEKKKPAAKPAYDSFLDSAWERLESIKTDEKEKPSSPNVRSPSPEPEYTEPFEWLDMQGPSDTINRVHDSLVPHPNIEESRESVLNQMKEKLNSLNPEDLLLNNEFAS